LRKGADDEALDSALTSIWQKRDDQYSELRSAATSSTTKVEMSYIGG
jgi:cyclic pyranopterin phosphate synthase